MFRGLVPLFGSPILLIIGHHLRCSFTSPFCSHGGQLPPRQSKLCLLTPDKLDLCLDVCQNAIDLLNRDREPDRFPMNWLSVFHALSSSRMFGIDRIGR